MTFGARVGRGRVTKGANSRHPVVPFFLCGDNLHSILSLLLICIALPLVVMKVMDRDSTIPSVKYAELYNIKYIAFRYDPEEEWGSSAVTAD